jgi:hypothetical protein
LLGTSQCEFFNQCGKYPKRRSFELFLMLDIMNLVLQPSKELFKDMVHELEIVRNNPDGADQGFIGSYFSDLLDQPMFHLPPNGTKLHGTYRLPLGYQMDATYYCM